MGTRSGQRGRRLTWRRKAIHVLSLAILFSLVAACGSSNSNVHFAKIKTPSAIRHLGGRPTHKQGNLARYELGAVKHSGEIVEITELGAMWSRPLGNQTYMPDLSGAAFTIDFDNQWSHMELLGSTVWWHTLDHVAVLEYTFPKATDPGMTEINWFVTPHLRCRYEMQQSEEGREPGVLVPSHESIPNADLWFEYLVFQDPLGAFDLLRSDEDVVLAFLGSGFEDEQEYLFQGNANGTLRTVHDERSGKMHVPAGTRAKLYVGVSVLMQVYQRDDRIRLGGDALPTVISDPDRCTLDFGSNSYYTMRPATGGG